MRGMLKDIKNRRKRSKIHFTGMSKKKKVNGEKVISKEKMDAKFPELIKNVNLSIQAAHIPGGINETK